MNRLSPLAKALISASFPDSHQEKDCISAPFAVVCEDCLYRAFKHDRDSPRNAVYSFLSILLRLAPIWAVYHLWVLVIPTTAWLILVFQQAHCFAMLSHYGL